MIKPESIEFKETNKNLASRTHIFLFLQVLLNPQICMIKWAEFAESIVRKLRRNQVSLAKLINQVRGSLKIHIVTIEEQIIIFVHLVAHQSRVIREAIRTASTLGGPCLQIRQHPLRLHVGNHHQVQAVAVEAGLFFSRSSQRGVPLF